MSECCDARANTDNCASVTLPGYVQCIPKVKMCTKLSRKRAVAYVCGPSAKRVAELSRTFRHNIMLTCDDVPSQGTGAF